MSEHIIIIIIIIVLNASYSSAVYDYLTPNKHPSL